MDGNNRRRMLVNQKISFKSEGLAGRTGKTKTKEETVIKMRIEPLNIRTKGCSPGQGW